MAVAASASARCFCASAAFRSCCAWPSAATARSRSFVAVRSAVVARSLAASAEAACCSARTRCCPATRACHVVVIIPAIKASAIAAAAATGPLCRTANFLTRYAVPGGPARTGSLFRYLSISAANSDADAYRQRRSLSIAFMTIESRSPAKSRLS